MAIKRLRINYLYFILILALALGAFLHFRNLDNAIFLDEDEARPFQLLNSGPLIYLICSPIFDIFLTQASVFYIVAFLGFFSIVLIYFIFRFSLDNRSAIYATLIYAVFPLRIDYARTLYPAIFVEFFFLLAFLFAYLSLLKRKAWLMVPVGIFSACILFGHYFGYALIFGIIMFILLFYFTQKRAMQDFNLLGSILRFVLGFLLAYFFLEKVLLMIDSNYFYIQKIISFYGFEIASAKYYIKELPAFIKTIVSRITLSTQSLIIAAVSAIALIFGFLIAFRKKKLNILLFSVPYISGTSLFILLASLQYHSIKERHFVWLVSLFSLLAAFLAIRLWERFQGKVKIIIGAFYIFFLGLLFLESYQVTVETYKNTEIISWLENNNIMKKEVLTYWNLFTPKDKGKFNISPIPIYFEDRKLTNDPLWFIRDAKFRIYWPMIILAYQLGKCKYIITSGISSKFTLGEDEPFLQDVTPLKSWLHPYSRLKHRVYYVKGQPHYIKVYSLAHVFVDTNSAFYLMKEQSIKAQK